LNVFCYRTKAWTVIQYAGSYAILLASWHEVHAFISHRQFPRSSVFDERFYFILNVFIFQRF